MHHAKDLNAFIGGIYRMLKKGGRAAIADIDREDGTFHENNEGVYHKGFDRDALFDAFDSAGFTGIRFKDAGTRFVERNSREYPLFIVTAKKRGKAEKALNIWLGHLFTALGAAGVVLPLVPTTPFLLLAAAFYLRGSNKFYKWLVNHRVLGKYIRDYLEGRGVPVKAKISAIALLWVTISASVIFLIKIAAVKILLLCIAAGVTVHIAMLKTRREKAK